MARYRHRGIRWHRISRRLRRHPGRFAASAVATGVVLAVIAAHAPASGGGARIRCQRLRVGKRPAVVLS
jgi:hypothetical protein